jgi:hypothetical protein
MAYLGSNYLLDLLLGAQLIPRVHRHGTRRQCGRASPQLLRSIYESASDEDVDVTSVSVKRTRIDDTVMESFHVDPEGKPVIPTATQIGTSSSAEHTRAPIEVDSATPSTFTAHKTTNDVTRAGAANG